MNTVAKTRLGLEAASRLVRRMPASVLLALDLLSRIDSRPRLVKTRGHHGCPELRLRYRTFGRWRWLHLGQTKKNEYESLLARAIKARWPVNDRELNRTIRTLTRLRSASRKRVTALAATCGYRFRGWMIHRIGGKG